MGVGERVVIVNGLEMARNVFSPSSFLLLEEEGVSFWGREERGKGYVRQGGLIFRNLNERISAMNENLVLRIFKSDNT